MNKAQNILDINLKRAKDSLRNYLDDKKKTTPLKNMHMQLNLAERQQKQNLVCRTQRQTCWNQHTCMKNKAKKRSKQGTTEHSALITWQIAPPKAYQKCIKDEQNASDLFGASIPPTD